MAIIGCEIGVVCLWCQVAFVALEDERGKVVETCDVLLTWVVRVESMFSSRR